MVMVVILLSLTIMIILATVMLFPVVVTVKVASLNANGGIINNINEHIMMVVAAIDTLLV